MQEADHCVPVQQRAVPVVIGVFGQRIATHRRIHNVHAPEGHAA